MSECRDHDFEDDEYEDERLELSVVDPQTGRVRLLDAKCKTCLFHPGNLMNLAEGRLKSLIDGIIAEQSQLICHSTLPALVDEPFSPAICRGFADAHWNKSPLLRFARDMRLVMEVPRPRTLLDGVRKSAKEHK